MPSASSAWSRAERRRARSGVAVPLAAVAIALAASAAGLAFFVTQSGFREIERLEAATAVEDLAESAIAEALARIVESVRAGEPLGSRQVAAMLGPEFPSDAITVEVPRTRAIARELAAGAEVGSVSFKPLAREPIDDGSPVTGVAELRVRASGRFRGRLTRRDVVWRVAFQIPFTRGVSGEGDEAVDEVRWGAPILAPAPLAQGQVEP